MAITRRKEAAVSDIVGTVLILAITIVVIGAAAVTMASSKGPTIPVRLAFSANANATSIQLVHLGGASIDEGTLRARVSVNGTPVLSVMLGPSGTMWSVGGIVNIPLSKPLATGSSEITITGVTIRTVIATASVSSPYNGALTTLNGFVISNVSFNGSASATVVAPGQVTVQVTVTHPEGRKFVRYVYANLSSVNGPSYVALRDDGAGGDASAGDGIWSGVLSIPLSSPKNNQTVTFTAVDLPGASTNATATVKVV